MKEKFQLYLEKFTGKKIFKEVFIFYGGGIKVQKMDTLQMA